MSELNDRSVLFGQWRQRLIRDGHLYAVACAILLIVAAGLRFYELSENSLWLDEAATANCARGSSLYKVLRCTRGHSSPILYPWVLHAVQKVESSPFSVRLVPAVASTATVFALLFLLPRVGVHRMAAFLAALMAALSSAAIDHAQDVREYSVDALIVALLIAGVLAYLRNGARALLCTALFFAPLVQYGLVLFSTAALGTLLINSRGGWIKRCKALAWPGASFAVGCAITYAVTLQYQWRSGSFGPFYLSRYYYDGAHSDVGSMLAFALSRTRWLLNYHLPDPIAMPLLAAFAAALVLGFLRGFRQGAIPLLFALSLFSAMVASVLRWYPLGDIRHCIYLGPIVFLTFGYALHSVADLLPVRVRWIPFGTAVSVIALAGADAIKTDNPYRETYNAKGIVAALEERVQKGDVIYVYSLGAPSINFYLREKPDNYYSGKCGTPVEACAEEVYRVSPHANRVWYVALHDRALDWERLEEFDDGIRVEHVIAEPRANLHLIQNLDRAAEFIVHKRAGQLIIDSKFEVYLNEHALTYVKEPCIPADTQGEFSLKIFPIGLDQGKSLVFPFDRYGALSEGKCVATVPLPNYDIARLSTSQRLRVGQLVWQDGARLASFRWKAAAAHPE